MYNLAASEFKGLYGLGSVNRDSIDNNILVNVNDGAHSPLFSTSKQIDVPLKLGWNNLVNIVTLGGLNG